MKKRIIVLIMVLTLSISLSACGGNKPISSNNSGKDKTGESEQEIQTEDDTKDNAERGGEIIFTITSKKDGILVEPNRTIELSYEDGKWKVVNEGY